MAVASLNTIFMKTTKTQGTCALQLHSQSTFSTLCEVKDAFDADEKVLKSAINAEIKKNKSMYDAYSKADHSDIGSHTHVFDAIDFGCGYLGYIGVSWPSKSPRLLKVLTKYFTLRDNYSNFDMMAAYIQPLNVNERLFVFFTDIALQSWLDLTKFGRFFLLFRHCNKGYVTFRDEDCALVSPIGILYGQKTCRFCIFNEFSFSISCPSRMTQFNKEMISEVVWEGFDWDD